CCFHRRPITFQPQARRSFIQQPKDELGELAIDVLIHRITQPTLQQQRLQLTPILMERGSA
ncbi:hypothetical protein ACUOA8_35420, partial [Escherichia sp. SS-MK2]